MDITEVKDLVWAAFKTKFPDFSGYTWFLTLWMDDTFKLTLRHAKLIKDGELPECELHMFTWYDGKITYQIKTGINLNQITHEEIL